MSSAITIKNIHPLTDFKRNTTRFIARMESTGDPVVLTINGKAKLVVQDAESYQKLLDAAEDAAAGIQRGLDAAEEGRVQPAKAAFDEIRRRHKIPRRSI